ncbi:secretion protein HlyD [Proteus vulgaris]|uniref:secretion protein HlyD n=1 Tax=Proteus faecis TaxID=2050967 RepID=UPI00163D0E4D|nr:secretion protein HlyD [Proteus faecis]MDM3867295.1 secretion protein HlyD [Proteus faecis]QNH66699.1 secretion protein HlyD [Proteus vulgaris]
MKTKKVSLFIILMIIIGIIAGIYYYEENKESELVLYGNVDIRTVNLSFRVAGRLDSLLVDEGAPVQKGQLLGKLDDAPYRNALNKAYGERDSAIASLALMEAGYRTEEIAQAQSDVSLKQAAWQYADNFYKRQQDLAKRKVISANDLDSARNNRNQAAAALKAAQDKLSQYQNGYRKEDIEAAKGQVMQAKAAVAQAELNLQDTQLISPSQGTVLTRAVEPGTMLSAGSPVFTVSLTNPVWVRAYISETHLNEAIPNREVYLYTDGRKDKPYHGTIGFVSPTAEFTPKSVETPELRTDLVYRLRVVVTDADDELRQGMPVTLKFASSH